MNRPLLYSDPTGHKSCYNTGEGGDCEDTKEEKKLNRLFDYIDHSIKNKKRRLKSGLTSLEAMVKVVNRAAQIYGNDWSSFLNATSLVFTGVYQHGAGAMLAARQSGNVGLIDGASGFHPDFQDVDGSQQVRHFWAGFATAANPSSDNRFGAEVASWGNNWHEINQDTVHGSDGATVKDYALTLTAIDMAKHTGNSIKNPSDLAAVLAYRLGVSGPGYTGAPINRDLWWTPDN